MKSKFSSEVLRGRLKKGYTQSQVAEAVSVSLRWYQKIESGERLPGAVVMIRLILLLELNTEAFREEVGLRDSIHTVHCAGVFR